MWRRVGWGRRREDGGMEGDRGRRTAVGRTSGNKGVIEYHVRCDQVLVCQYLSLHSKYEDWW